MLLDPVVTTCRPSAGTIAYIEQIKLVGVKTIKIENNHCKINISK